MSIKYNSFMYIEIENNSIMYNMKHCMEISTESKEELRREPNRLMIKWGCVFGAQSWGV